MKGKDLMSKNRRRGVLFGLTVASVALSLTSVAWACTVFKGKITLQGNASTSTVTYVGDNKGMAHCANSNSYAYANTPGTVKVTVAGVSSSCSGTHKLPISDTNFSSLSYGVTYIQNGFYNGKYDPNRNCMWNGGSSGRIALYDSNGSARISIDSTGYGTSTKKLPSGLAKQDGAPYEGAVCVSDMNYGTSLYGNAAPLVVL